MSGTESPAVAVRRGRPRDAARDRALLAATLAVLAESGYGGLTTAAVAARAGVSTATLYRRWSSKEALVLAASAAFAADLEQRPDTGTLEGDLRILLRDKAAGLTGESGRLMRALIGEAAHNVALAEALTAALIDPVRDRVAEAVRRAVARGEIAPLPDVDLVADLVIGPMVSRFLLTAHPSDTQDTQDARGTADRLLPFVLRAVGGQDASGDGGFA
ncbi:TetR/AcrR family transcriptional regulator [Streptomyces roseirectus]|uniref:TetR/AcrR family transcriptional regulator n=1 Tax=Streptomyces roseirectus TaxID=2768066 RepID=A0A7H0INP2_9ACTN|nr:TetR/AcrR family transcriptional regulator [Streptomyces roseirectus]QNP74408.1 TetR/AcrR family transcriptional regulator [Streptomyces roseirectus]